MAIEPRVFFIDEESIRASDLIEGFIDAHLIDSLRGGSSIAKATRTGGGQITITIPILQEMSPEVREDLLSKYKQVGWGSVDITTNTPTERVMTLKRYQEV
jgi:hypothetical protein